MDLYVIYNDFDDIEEFFIVDEKTMQQKTSINELNDDYPEYIQAPIDVQLEILNVYHNGDNDTYKVFKSPAPQFLVALIKKIEQD